MEYFDVQVRNQWAALSYWVGGVEIKAPCVARVRWPDGCFSEALVVAEPYHTSYSESGQRRAVKTAKLMALGNLHGLAISIPLEHLHVGKWRDVEAGS